MLVHVNYRFQLVLPWYYYYGITTLVLLLWYYYFGITTWHTDYGITTFDALQRKYMFSLIHKIRSEAITAI